MKRLITILVGGIFFISAVVFAVDKIEPLGLIELHMPRPAAGDLRYHITIHKFYQKWAIWPGKEKMYKGKEPHGALLTTYVNDIALDSLKKSRSMANGAIIVKENYDKNKKLMAVTVMYKVKNYNPDGGDWFWVKYDADFEILEEGKIKGCIDCHGTVKENDYIFTGKVTGK